MYALKEKHSEGEERAENITKQSDFWSCLKCKMSDIFHALITASFGALKAMRKALYIKLHRLLPWKQVHLNLWEKKAVIYIDSMTLIVIITNYALKISVLSLPPPYQQCRPKFRSSLRQPDVSCLVPHVNYIIIPAGSEGFLVIGGFELKGGRCRPLWWEGATCAAWGCHPSRTWMEGSASGTRVCD